MRSGQASSSSLETLETKRFGVAPRRASRQLESRLTIL